VKDEEGNEKGARRGRKPKDLLVVPNLARKLKTVVRHTLPDLWTWFEQLPDPRDPTRTYYRMKKVLWTGILFFLSLARSRRHFRSASDSPAFLANLNTLAEENKDAVPHPDTVVRILDRIAPAPFRELPSRIVSTLLRKRILESSRLDGRYLVAIDATRIFSSKSRHCPQCLVQRHSEGDETYYHMVLEAKLVTPGGLAFSVATEFVENLGEDVPVQDCELKAFYRLAPWLKAHFPRTEICLLLDGLYANDEVLTICEQNGWSFIITFKEGSAPRASQDFETLRRLQSENTLSVCENGETQRLSWVTGLVWGNHRFNVLECALLKDDCQIEKRFVWLTDIALSPRNVTAVANKGGRCRWTIENQGFNVQKNGEFHLEHPFSRQERAWKNLYLLLQIAHVLQQLLYWWRELKPVREYLGSLYGFLRRFLEHMRTMNPSGEDVVEPAFQLRLDTG
jgi:hypothetical protein